jgi:hypothetical protein
MNLTAEQFAEAVAALQAPGEAAPPAGGTALPVGERRRAPRVAHRGKASITLGDDPRGDVPTNVVVKDLSPRGVGIVHARRLRRGETFVLRLSRDDGQRRPVAILCTVAHCRQVDKSLYNIGAEFTCLIGDARDAQPATPGQVVDDLERIRRSVLD